MASTKQVPKATKSPTIKTPEAEAKKVEAVADTTTKDTKSELKSTMLEIVAQAKARVTRTAQTNISMSCREVIAMLNGIKDSIEKL